MIVADGVRDRESYLRRQARLSASADALALQLEQLEGRTSALEVALAAKAQELSDARQLLADARNALSAAIRRRHLRRPGPGHHFGQHLGRRQPLRGGRYPRRLPRPLPAGGHRLSRVVMDGARCGGGHRERPWPYGCPRRGRGQLAGAMGPMQFLSRTWAAYGVDGDRDGTADVYNPTDAVWAANYLCANCAADPARLAGPCGPTTTPTGT